MKALTESHFEFPGQESVYHGKVREVFSLKNNRLVIVSTDRISAFDAILPKGIPYKGQVLNQIAAHFLDATAHIVPNWKEACPDPMATVGKKADPFKVEMVIRSYLSGHAARLYKSGKREICGVPMPEGMKENDAFPAPIITPATKAEQGEHDEDIAREDIISRGIVSESDYLKLEEITQKLFALGQKMANQRGLILVDTKYEFGKLEDGTIVLIDEIHTPDSSRYFYAEGYEMRQKNGEKQKQLSKEFVREWLIENGFQGLEGQQIPQIPDEFVTQVSERYIELYEKITGNDFEKTSTENLASRIEENITNYLNKN